MAILVSMSAATAETLVASLHRFGLERDRMRAMVAHAAGISATDLDALEHLEADGPLTQRQLGDRLSLTSGAITMLVDRLEQLGWVRRGPHPSDRRYTLLALSAKALKDTPPALSSYHKQLETLAEQVSVDQLEVISSFLLAASNAASITADELGDQAASS